MIGDFLVTIRGACLGYFGQVSDGAFGVLDGRAAHFNMAESPSSADLQYC